MICKLYGIEYDSVKPCIFFNFVHTLQEVEVVVVAAVVPEEVEEDTEEVVVAAVMVRLVLNVNVIVLESY